MIFIENKYHKYYYQIVESARARGKLDAYQETHHIIPKSLGGDNSAGNLVSLTAREHYVCHRLLPRMLTGDRQKKMIYALYCITHVRNQGQEKRHVPNSRLYSKIKEDWRLSIQGKAAHNKGKPMSEEQKEKLRQANLGKASYIRTAETKERMSIAQKGISKGKGRVSNRKGITMSSDQKEKIRQSMAGKNTGARSTETIDKMRGAKRRICRLSDKKEMSVNSFNRDSR